MSDNSKLHTAVSIVERLQSAGYTAYFAGGCVRDKIMGRSSDDYDIATSAAPPEIKALFKKTVAVGEQFGVILVIEDGMQFEVATFRSEGAYTDGRHPSSVEFTDAERDAQRRDFTCNGLFFDPANGGVIDHVGGQADIEKKVLRCIGSAAERFTEDKLRILRAIRFACKLGFEIEARTYEAVKAMAPDIKQVSVERIRDELTKMFTGPSADRALVLLRDCGLLEIILPEVNALAGVQQPEQFHPEGDVFEHTRIMLSMLETPSLELAFATLLHDVAKPVTYEEADRIRFNKHDVIGAEMAEEIMRRLRFSNAQIEAVSIMVANHMRFMHVKHMKPNRLDRFMLRPSFIEEMELHRVDCASSHADMSIYEFLRDKYEELQKRPPKTEPLLCGKDLLGLGYEEGPGIGKILREVEEAYLEGELKNKEEALKFVKERFKNG